MSAHFKIPTLWSAFASMAISTAIWQANVAVHANQSLGKIQPISPIRIHRLSTHSKLSVSADEAYTIRCGMGITRAEIGWIIDDFKAVGIDSSEQAVTRDACLTLRRSQQKWYHDALVEALSLDRVQSRQAMQRLNQNLVQAASIFIESLDRSQHPRSAEESCIDTLETQTIREFISADHWLFDPRISAQSWNLCTLTPEQEKITWKQWQENRSNRCFLLPEPNCINILSVRRLSPTSLMPANMIFPFLTNQTFKESSNPLEILTDDSAAELISQISVLHPAQLKILLLLKPAMATQIGDALQRWTP
ncbi:MAG: hypothetical protein ORN51_15775 [Akkermansiaceae bacterium]|nr:hypothetical protein [Akkermansiaceae bacterium]